LKTGAMKSDSAELKRAFALLSSCWRSVWNVAILSLRVSSAVDRDIVAYGIAGQKPMVASLEPVSP